MKKYIAPAVFAAVLSSLPLSSIYTGIQGDRELADLEELGSCDYLKQKLMNDFESVNSLSEFNTDLAYRNRDNPENVIVLPQIQNITLTTQQGDTCSYTIPIADF